ncbi:hypothetical protein P153DRAFT_270938, partial [Dothidotthia symphoricarpi CBS 119687]
MPATTRATTGHSRPRIVSQAAALLTPTTKANTSKPRSNKVASGRIAKPSTTTTTTTTTTKTSPATAPKTKVVKKRSPVEKAKDAVVGSAEKVVGEVTGRPGKKAAGTKKIRGTASTSA